MGIFYYYFNQFLLHLLAWCDAPDEVQPLFKMYVRNTFITMLF